MDSSKTTVKTRNVLFSKRTEKFLNGLQDEALNHKVQRYIRSNLRRWLINSFEDVKPIKKAEPLHPSWLHNAIDRGDEVYPARRKTSPFRGEDIRHTLTGIFKDATAILCDKD